MELIETPCEDRTRLGHGEASVGLQETAQCLSLES